MNCIHEPVIDEGQQICCKCGTDLGKYITEEAEWREYSDSKSGECRSGFIHSELLPETYGSFMSFNGAKSAEMRNIQRLTNWSMSTQYQRSWLSIFDSIQISCSYIGIPKAVVMHACQMYQQMEDAQKVRGETRRALMAGAVYVACCSAGAPQTHDKISELFVVKIRPLCKAINQYCATNNSVLDTQIGMAETICTKMNIADEVREKILLKLATISDDIEHTPKTVVAGVIAVVMWQVSGNKKLPSKTSLQSISDASGVSCLSIHKFMSKIS